MLFEWFKQIARMIMIQNAAFRFWKLTVRQISHGYFNEHG
uniref:Uncharacterized protein n=1 Tax=Lepeophtheirus salmonis TaxID=72036 RepID=A0A0K2TW01_LEPSM